MRTIGAKNRALVKKLTEEAIESKGGFRTVDDTVLAKLPIGLWDIWEGADTEIRNIIDETIMETNYGF